jgi:hypothetical protein
MIIRVETLRKIFKIDQSPNLYQVGEESLRGEEEAEGA